MSGQSHFRYFSSSNVIFIVSKVRLVGKLIINT
jgi:hypothetical protein